MVLFHLIFLLCTTIRPKIRVHTDLFLFFVQGPSMYIYNLFYYEVLCCGTSILEDSIQIETQQRLS